MTVRTSTKTVTFKRPFVLGDMDELLPPGDYTVETQEELVPGVSFLAYRRVSVVVHLPSPSGDPAQTRTVTLHPRVLDEALLRDASP
jgi:hypothetical protein